MSRKLSIQLKAAFLVLVFGLNTAIGFACAIGVDMGFNKTHHREETAGVHVHKDGTKHHHKKQDHKHSQLPGKDDCCNDKVIKLSQADKAVPHSEKPLSPVVFTVFAATYYSINIIDASPLNAPNKYYVSGHHPPIPDIRIAIRSFQI